MAQIARSFAHFNENNCVSSIFQLKPYKANISNSISPYEHSQSTKLINVNNQLLNIDPIIDNVILNSSVSGNLAVVDSEVLVHIYNLLEVDIDKTAEQPISFPYDAIETPVSLENFLFSSTDSPDSPPSYVIGTSIDEEDSPLFIFEGTTIPDIGSVPPVSDGCSNVPLEQILLH